MFSVFGPQLPLLTFSVCGAQRVITCVAIAINILAKAASYISQPVITWEPVTMVPPMMTAALIEMLP